MQFIEMTDDTASEAIDVKSGAKHLNIVFSHNINAETHPCGCRNFPLGGLPQVAGKLYELKKKEPTIYIDTGDTFFMSVTVPDSLKESQTFSAIKLNEAMSKLGMKFFLPGDQDFALGQSFLERISKSSHYTFLISNLKKDSKIKHRKFKILKFGNQKILFLAIANPDLYGKSSKYFSSATKAITDTMKEAQKKGFDPKQGKVILLSHSGIDYDKAIARDFPFIDWIIGSHTQSFLRSPVEIGKTKIVQVLSRNHYLGHIKIAANKKAKDKYEIVETRDELKDLWKDNPFMAWLDQYKKDLEAIQQKEQTKLSESFAASKSAPTYASCVECHEDQTNFWQKTPHSLAFITLHNAKASYNPKCVGCHSLHYNETSGFSSKTNIIKTDKDHAKYWQDFEKLFSKTKSIRQLSKKQRMDLSNKWVKLDEKYEITHNFANVQCLNCHDKDFDHPFALNEKKVKTNYQAKCIECHTKDQSPQWYEKESLKINKAIFNKKLKEVSCPKHE
jgi:hypothetical protein